MAKIQMNSPFEYALLYPEMPYEICVFFSANEMKDGTIIHKQVYQFCDHYSKRYPTSPYPQPRDVTRICDILCDSGMITLINKAGVDYLNSRYMGHFDKVKLEKKFDPYVKQRLNFLVFGFRYIYEEYMKYVLPVVFTNRSGDILVGTSFMYDQGIATARHCIEDAEKIAIRGISKESLQTASFEVHPNNLMDLLYIRLQDPLPDSIMFNRKAEILDEVMTMGFPKIAGFHNFLTAETATVSSRLTVSTGQIAANAEDIWMKENLFLITAKIQGGNSGGPVISKDGSVVGIGVNKPEGYGNYDELGYGTVIPVSFLDGLIGSSDKNLLDISKIEFRNFD